MKMFSYCTACGGENGTAFRNCEGCRKAWRLSKRKPGGPAEQAEALHDLIGVVRSLLPHAENEGDETTVAVARRKLSRAESIARMWGLYP